MQGSEQVILIYWRFERKLFKIPLIQQNSKEMHENLIIRNYKRNCIYEEQKIDEEFSQYYKDPTIHESYLTEKENYAGNNFDEYFRSKLKLLEFDRKLVVHNSLFKVELLRYRKYNVDELEIVTDCKQDLYKIFRSIELLQEIIYSPLVEISISSTRNQLFGIIERIKDFQKLNIKFDLSKGEKDTIACVRKHLRNKLLFSQSNRQKNALRKLINDLQYYFPIEFNVLKDEDVAVVSSCFSHTLQSNEIEKH
jgi:hypothetical protein